jgi:hypothetical protein
VEITDGDFCIRLSLNNVSAGLRNFPVNVYAEHDIVFDICGRNFETVLRETETFFEFARRIRKCSSINFLKLLECWSKYFEDRASAINILAELEKEQAIVAERDSVCSRVTKDEVVKVSSGYLIYSEDSFYLVRGDGRVLKIRGRNKDVVSERLRKLYNGTAQFFQKTWLQYSCFIPSLVYPLSHGGFGSLLLVYQAPC